MTQREADRRKEKSKRKMPGQWKDEEDRELRRPVPPDRELSALLGAEARLGPEGKGRMEKDGCQEETIPSICTYSGPVGLKFLA